MFLAWLILLFALITFLTGFNKSLVSTSPWAGIFSSGGLARCSTITHRQADGRVAIEQGGEVTLHLHLVATRDATAPDKDEHAD